MKVKMLYWYSIPLTVPFVSARLPSTAYCGSLPSEREDIYPHSFIFLTGEQCFLTSYCSNTRSFLFQSGDTTVYYISKFIRITTWSLMLLVASSASAALIYTLQYLHLFSAISDNYIRRSQKIIMSNNSIKLHVYLSTNFFKHPKIRHQHALSGHTQLNSYLMQQ